MAKSVLIVDDDDLVVQFAHLVLAQAGYQVSSAPSGEDALRTLALAQPSLVLLDIALPDMTGLKVLELLRGIRKLKTPIVMMTARNDAATVRQAVAAGANGYIVKPFKPDTLIERVETLLRPPRPRPPLDDALVID